MVNKLIMEEKNPRRAFLGKLALGASSIVALPILGSAKNSTKEEEKVENKPIIKRVRPLGFQWETQDPFLFCVHHEDFYPEGQENMGPDPKLLSGRQMGQDFIVKDGWRMYHGQTVPGFPAHPHRGFETITVVRDGLVDHADSTGAAGRYGNGDVQWMTAGKGVQHSEMFPLLKDTEENRCELFQIWLNLPKKNKMVEPHFAMLWGETIPKISGHDSSGNGVYVEVIAGNMNDHTAPAPPPDSWASDEDNHVGIFNIKLDPGASFELGASAEGVNRTVYYYEGNGLKLVDTEIPNYHAADVDGSQALKFENGKEESKVLILQGKPIAEPVVQHGPFVMNTREEIQQAFQDYHATQYGGWPWPKYDQVHDRTKGRFALHSDGREEIKEG